MIEKKLPRDRRDRLAVFTDAHGIVAVEGLGIDWSRRPQEDEPVLTICIEGIEQ